MSELKTVPSFTFYQDGEIPIEVSYYHCSIELLQEDRSIILDNDAYLTLFKEIKKHFNDAQEALNKK